MAIRTIPETAASSGVSEANVLDLARVTNLMLGGM